MSDRTTPDAPHVALPGTDWAFWPQVVLRGAGFPAAGVEFLASPALARLADGLAGPDAADPDTRAQYQAAFDSEMDRVGGRLIELAADRRFGLAMAWQNHRIFDTAIAPMLRNQVDGRIRRNSQQRQHEELITGYWLRYCLKNDTIGFFGPVGWSTLDARAETSRLDVGPGLIASSEVFFEPWAIDQLAAVLGSTPQMASWVAPRRLPFVRVTGRRAADPAGVSVELSQVEASVLERCTGQVAARDIARELAGRVAGADTEAAVYAVIERLRDKRLVSWRLEVPWTPYPERYLRRFLHQVGDEALAADGLRQLDLLESAKDAARLAAQGEAAELVSALRDLDETFTEMTGAQSSHNNGRTYGGRTLLYHDARRDTELVLGADFLTALQPLGLLLDSARWLTYNFGVRLQELFSEVADTMAASGAAIDLASFWFACMPVVYRTGTDVINNLQREFQERWAGILRVPPATRRVWRQSAALADEVRQTFDAPHSVWADGRYCSPDVMIAADGIDAVNRGDFELVLGEMHLAIPTGAHYCFVTQHPSPADMFSSLAADSPGPRLLTVLPKRLTVRTQSALTRDIDFQIALAKHTTDPQRPRVLNAADLIVTPSPAGPAVSVAGELYPVIDLFNVMLLHTFMNSFQIRADADHQPRVTVDRFVLARESWRFAATELSFAQARDQSARFLGARQWWRTTGLPRQVFVKTPNEMKPFFVDFDNVISVNILAKAVRQVSKPGGPVAWIKFSEMLPATDQLWLSDAAGKRYTSELRIVAVDQRRIDPVDVLAGSALAQPARG